MDQQCVLPMIAALFEDEVLSILQINKCICSTMCKDKFLLPVLESIPVYVFGLWVGAGVPGENPHKQGQNMQTYKQRV